MSSTQLSEKDQGALRSFMRRIDPSDSGAQNNLGVVFFQRDMVEEAIEQFQLAVKLDPKMHIAQRNLEIAYRDTGYYDRRIAELRERLRLAPDLREARWELGRVYVSLGLYDQARDEFEQLVNRHPDDVAVLIQLGLVEKNAGNLEAATEWLKGARKIDSDSGVIHFYLGEVLYNRGLNRDALESLRRAIDLNSDNADAHYEIAFVLGDMGMHEEAREATKRAIKLNPSLGRVQTNLSLERLQRADGRTSKGIDARRVNRPSLESSLAHYHLGIAFRQHGLFVEALREYRLALERGEPRKLVLAGMAEVELLRRDYAAALRLYDGLIEEGVEEPRILNERGVVLHQLGHFEEAMTSYKRACEVDESYGLAQNNHASRAGMAWCGKQDRSCAAAPTSSGTVTSESPST